MGFIREQSFFRHMLPLIVFSVSLFLITFLPALSLAAPAKGKSSLSTGPTFPRAPAGRTYLGEGNGSDLVIDSTLYVREGTYRYRNINIVKNGKLIFLDAAITFWAKSILIEDGGYLYVGSTQYPIKNNVITFYLYGSDKETDAITCKTPRCGFTTEVFPSAQSNLPGGVSDTLYPYERLPGDDDLPEGAYFGRKVIAVSYGGTLRMYGSKGATYTAIQPWNSGTSWVRLAKTADPGKTDLVVDRSVDWKPKDTIVVTTTDYLPGHSEMLTISAVDPAKKTITVEKPFTFPHNGERYDLGQFAVPDRLQNEGFTMKSIETRAAVALLSRNIRILSGGPSLDTYLPGETSTETDRYFGGHIIVRQGFKQFQMQGVELYQLGQGGRMAHSPVNFHLVRQVPGYTFVQDCSIHDSMTRWIELRGAQKVTLARNVGYKSMGHGYLLAEGTEINNYIRANIGIYARPAVAYRDNPRNIPGVLSKKDFELPDEFTKFAGDYIHPSVFFIMNGYNNIDYNMAAGAGTCGACFWYAPAKISGLSAQQRWSGYAQIQNGIQSGLAPIKSFSGNFCSTAQYSVMTIHSPGVCRGVRTPINKEKGKDAFDPIENPLDSTYSLFLYPQIPAGASLQATRCTDDRCSDSLNNLCAKGNTANCVVNVLDNYTSSFHWAQQNFSAIWLRTNWFLFQNSALTDILNGGLTMVSGGSYDQVANGYWALTRKSAFVGQTQPEAHYYAINRGPVNPSSPLICDGNTNAAYCLLKDEGVTYPIDNFSVYQRFYNIYDGPVYQETNAFLNIRERVVDCSKKVTEGECPNGYMYGTTGPAMTRAVGIPRVKAESDGPHKGECVFPNAAIGWKQPNGFYYPPAFHSRNLYFNDVDVRHFVIVPLFHPGTSSVDTDRVRKEYCTYNLSAPQDLFSNDFTDVDRQTELNDDDGSLAGFSGAKKISDGKQTDLEGSLSVNNDEFFRSPVQVDECLSEKSCFQVPYDHVSAVVFPQCAAKGQRNCTDSWGIDCKTRTCFGIPLFRQYLTAEEQKGPGQSIRMMGTAIYQRSTLVANNGKYYIDTRVSADGQHSKDFKNIFEGGKAYNVFLIYSKPTTSVTFELYVGHDGFNADTDVRMVRAGSATEDGTVLLVPPLGFTSQPTWPGGWSKTYDSSTGILTVTMDMKGFTNDYASAAEESCKPESFCRWDKSTKQCTWSAVFKSPFVNPIDFKGSSIVDNNRICQWSTKAVECPSGGCPGFQVRFPEHFVADAHDIGFGRPDPVPYETDSKNWNDNWNLRWMKTTDGFVGKECKNP